MEEVEKTLSVVKEFKRVEELRRKRAWEAHVQTQTAAYTFSAPVANGATQAVPPAPTAAIEPEHPTAAPMEVDKTATVVGERPLKRKRSVDEPMDTSHTPKKSRHGDGSAPDAIMQSGQPTRKSLPCR